MKYDETLADRVRELLSASDKPITEKLMFGGLTFMVDDKICVGVKSDKMLVRIAPEECEAALEKPGVTTMRHGKSAMNGFLFVDVEELSTNRELKHWIKLALDFNPLANRAERKKEGVKKK